MHFIECNSIQKGLRSFLHKLQDDKQNCKILPEVKTLEAINILNFFANNFLRLTILQYKSDCFHLKSLEIYSDLVVFFSLTKHKWYDIYWGYMEFHIRRH